MENNAWTWVHTPAAVDRIKQVCFSFRFQFRKCYAVWCVRVVFALTLVVVLFYPRICILNRMFQRIVCLSIIFCECFLSSRELEHVYFNFFIWQVLNKWRKKWRLANVCTVTRVHIRKNWSNFPQQIRMIFLFQKKLIQL